MTSSDVSFRASRNAIHKLQHILSGLTETDSAVSINDSEIWQAEDIESELVLEQTRKMANRNASIGVSSARTKELRELLDVVDFLKYSLEKRASYFDQHKYGRILLDLPDDVLVHIFILAKLGINELTRLLLVCKRFKDVALSSSRLWVFDMKSSMPRQMIDIIGIRSGALGLSAELYCSEDADADPAWPGSSETIYKYSDKWTKVILDGYQEEDFLRFQTCNPSLKLTSLRELHITHGIICTDFFSLNEGWVPPLLKSLYCQWSIPAPHASLMLTDCTFEFEESVGIGMLADFLSATSILESLHISMYFVYKDLSGYDATVMLPSLKHFSFRSKLTDESHINDFFNAISFPNIISFRYTVCTTWYGEVISPFWTAVSRTTIQYPNLAYMHLGASIENHEVGGDGFLMNSIFTHLPKSLKSLSLKFDNIRLQINHQPSFGDFRHLRFLNFKDCNRPDLNFYRDAAEQVNNGDIKLDVLRVIYTHFDHVGGNYTPESEARMHFKLAGVLR